MKPLRVKICFFFTIVLIEILVWYKQALTLNPDFGFYLAIGKYILNSGIPKTDPFSYTMPSFPYINHEWLSNIITYKLYDIIGIEGLALISTLVIVSSLLIILPRSIKPYTFILLLLTGGAILPFANIRPQVITWLFSAILIFFGTSENLWKKYRFFIPGLMILWVNLHGGFAAGLLVLGFITITQTFKAPAEKYINFSIFTLSVLVTFVNPYGFRIWNEVLLTTTDSYLRSTVAEWGTVFVDYNLLSSISLTSYFLITFPLVLRYFRKLNFSEFSLYLIFLTLAIVSRRHVPFWLLISLPTAYHSFELFSKEHWLEQQVIKFIKLGTLFWSTLITLSFGIFIYQSMLSIRANYSDMEAFTYPVHAVKFMNTYHKEGNILSHYGWGGYLEWKLPEQKVFVDGRMPSWRWKAPNPSESDWAFNEYLKTTSGYTDFEATFKKYNITTVLWPTNYFKSRQKVGKASIGSSPLTLDAFTARLLRQGWKRAYADPVAVIYTKSKD